MLGIVGPRFRKATSTYHSIEKYSVNHLWNARASQDVPGMYKVPNMFKLLPVMSEILLPLAQVKILGMLNLLRHVAVSGMIFATFSVSWSHISWLRIIGFSHCQA